MTQVSSIPFDAEPSAEAPDAVRTGPPGSATSARKKSPSAKKPGAADKPAPANRPNPSKGPSSSKKETPSSGLSASKKPNSANAPYAASKPTSLTKPNAVKRPVPRPKPGSAKKPAPRTSPNSAKSHARVATPAAPVVAPANPIEAPSGVEAVGRVEVMEAVETTMPVRPPSAVSDDRPVGSAVSTRIVAPATAGTYEFRVARHRPKLIWAAAVVGGVIVLGGSAALIAANSGTHEAVPASASAPSGPERAAESWIIDNVPLDERVLLPKPMAVALVHSQAVLAGLVAYDDSVKASAIEAALSHGWRDLDYVVTVDGASSDISSSAHQASENSVLVASFGPAGHAIEVRRVVAQGATLAAAAAQAAATRRTTAGAELAENPAVRLSTGDRALVAAGRVDERILTVLGALAAGGDVTVAAFPVIDGEQAGPIRQVAIADIGGNALASGDQLTGAAVTLLPGLRGRFHPAASEANASNLVLTYDLWVDESFH